ETGRGMTQQTRATRARSTLRRIQSSPSKVQARNDAKFAGKVQRPCDVNSPGLTCQPGCRSYRNLRFAPGGRSGLTESGTRTCHNRGDRHIARRPMKLTPDRGGPRINEGIDTPNIQLIDATGNNVGVVGIADALARAAEAGLDLVEISPNS